MLLPDSLEARRNANAHSANRRSRQQRGFAISGRTTHSTDREQGLAAKRRKVSHEISRLGMPSPRRSGMQGVLVANSLAVVWQAIPTK